MPVGLERENYYETDGALALTRRDQPEKPTLKLLEASGNYEQPLQPANIISFTEFKLKRDQELFSQKLKLLPAALTLRSLRQEIISITSKPKTEPEYLKPEIKPDPLAEPKSNIPNIEPTPEPVKTRLPNSKANEKPINTGPDLLKGTGFTPLEEMASLKTKYNEGIAKGEDPKELLNRIVTENITNIRWYQWEYTMSDPVLPNPVALNEKGELVNSKSGYSIVDMTNEEERKGAVKASVVNIQKSLKDAKEGEMHMIISPPGWTGRLDRDGKPIIYPESEIFTFIKGKDGNLRALTFIADMDIDQCDQFRKAFIQPSQGQESEQIKDPKVISTIKRIEDMVTSPVPVTGDKASFDKVLDQIQVVMGGEVMREANGATRTFAEAREFLARGDELQKLPDLCEEIIQTYEKYLRANIENINDPDVYAAINQRMQLTVLEIAKTLKGDKTEAAKEVSFFYKQAMASTNIIDSKIMQNNYDAQIAYLRTRPGCNGGGASESANIFGSDLSQVLSGKSGAIISGGGGLRLSGEVTRCSKCNEEICEGKCFKCNIKYK